MNISSLLDDAPSEPAPHDRQQSQHAQPSHPAVKTPSYRPPQPPSIDTRSSSFAHPQSAAPHLTPHRTPSTQTHYQYPFPQHGASPGPPPSIRESSRPLDGIHPPTPGSRPSSQSYHLQATPVGYTHPAGPAPPLSATHSSASATPPAAQSPYSMRDGVSHQNSYHGSQYHPQHNPSTPLGPPPGQYQRSHDVSPYGPHQRSFSGASASNGRSIASNSPIAPYSSAPGRFVESPAAYNAPAPIPLKRPSTETLQHTERERSESVSPRTQVSRRQTSVAERPGSQDPWQGRASSQGRSEMDRTGGHAYQEQRPPSLTRSSASHLSQSAPSPLSQSRTQPSLSDGGHAASHVTARPPSHGQIQGPAMTSYHATPSRPMAMDHLNQPAAIETSQRIPVNTIPFTDQAHRDIMGAQTNQTAPLKRPAEEAPEPPHEAKKPRQIHNEPPVWARLHPSNPLYEAQLQAYPRLKDQAPPTQAPPKRPQQFDPPAQQAAAVTAQANGHSLGVRADEKKEVVSRILGMNWEPSISNTAPADKLLHGVAEFLYRTMLTRPQLGAGDPRNGSLEVEAKLGTLINKQGDYRLKLPVETPCIVSQTESKNLRFESFMDEAQHKALNVHVNGLIQRSMVPPRAPMEYKHRYERDAFGTLSSAGLGALPPAAKEELDRRKKEGRPTDLTLRTTVDVDPKIKGRVPRPPVIAQIVKMRLADLDIYCPNEEFDIRLSVNIEIDFHGRNDIDPGLLTLSPEEEVKQKNVRPVRFKDRLSYKHLAYSIDLTQVAYQEDRSGPKTHELEVEVNAAMMREQAERLRHGQENGFEALVEGLLNNVFLLSRVRPDAGGP